MISKITSVFKSIFSNLKPFSDKILSDQTNTFFFRTKNQIEKVSVFSITISCKIEEVTPTTLTISSNKPSLGRAILAKGNACIHVGFLLENEFSISTGSTQSKYKYIMTHALPVEEKTVIVVSFGNNLHELEKTLGACVKANEYEYEKESHSLTKGMQVIQEVLSELENRPFLCSGIQEMSVDQAMNSNHLNCKRFLQLVEKYFGFETDKEFRAAFEKFFIEKYDGMDRNKNQNLDPRWREEGTIYASACNLC